MPSVIKSNTKEFLAGNQASRAEFFDQVAKAYTREELFFITKIQTERMHRQATGEGTRVQTGMLRRNWFSTTIRVNNSIKALVWSTTPYALQHEEGRLYYIQATNVSAHMRNGKKGSSLVMRHQRAAHYAEFHAILGIGELWERDFLPTMAKRINALAEKHLR